VVAEQAACKEHPTEWWFPGKHASGFDGVPTPTVAKALAICRACPVRVECLDYAVDAVELGIWGGTFGKERRALRVQRNAQRRATPAAETPVVVSAPSERVIGIPHSKNSYLGDRIA
jgi:WhiB family redox-sensing transcriptional regulator